MLRYFAQRSFAEIGAALRITEEAARKRVDRALEKLQVTLSRRGITSTVAALGGALSAAGITTAPATLAGQVVAVALAESVLVPAAGLTATLASSLLPAAAMAALVTGLWVIVPQQRANTAMADEFARLERAPTSAAATQSEIDSLTLALAVARTSPASAQTAPAPVRAAVPAPATYPRLAGAKEVFVTTEGALQWEDQAVTLDEFLVRLTAYQTAAARTGSQLIDKGNGDRYPQLFWVLDEARKAGITHLVVESDSEPERYPFVPSSWF